MTSRYSPWVRQPTIILHEGNVYRPCLQSFLQFCCFFFFQSTLARHKPQLYCTWHWGRFSKWTGHERTKSANSFSTSSTGARIEENSCAPANLFLPHQHPYSVTPRLSSETFILAETQLQNKNDFLLRAGLYLSEQGQTHTSPHAEFKHRARSSITVSCRQGVLPWSLGSHLHPPGEGKLTYFIVLELAQGPDSSKMPTRTSPVWQALHYLLDGDCSLLCRRRAAHCWWGVGNPGTPVILHKARKHIGKL